MKKKTLFPLAISALLMLGAATRKELYETKTHDKRNARKN